MNLRHELGRLWKDPLLLPALGFLALAGMWYEYEHHYSINRDAYCRGFEIGWHEGYCAEEESCDAPTADPCPKGPSDGPETSFVMGIEAGLFAGADAAGLIEPPDPPEPFGR